MAVRHVLIAFLCWTATAVAGDTLVVKPARPTVGDSITFSLFNFDACCCGVYHDTAVGVADTTITLSFSLDEEPCTRCECFAAGSWIDFESGPLPAGTYGVYKAQATYCPPGMICALSAAGPVMLVRIGQVTVRDTSLTSSRRVAGRAAPQSALAAGYNPSSRTVWFALPRAQRTVVGLFSADGRSTKLANGWFSAGVHVVDVGDRGIAPGAYVLRVEGERRSWSGRVLHVH
jgi:hypothetical protein